MIPPFDDLGYLPAGVHPATLEEIEVRVGRTSEIRRAQMDSVRWMVAVALRAGAARIVLNGSFVTDIIEPNDVDCVLLFLPHVRRDRTAMRELKKGLPFLEIKRANPQDFAEFVNIVFASDRSGTAKGIIEVTT